MITSIIFIHIISFCIWVAGGEKVNHVLGGCLRAVDGVCPTSFDGFAFMCSATNSTLARQVCEERGWQLAQVDDANAGAALQTHRWCAVESSAAWISSFNGLSADPCMIQSLEGGAIAGQDWRMCAEERFPVLCQRPARSVIQTTSTTTRTIITGAVLSTVTVKPTCRARNPHLKGMNVPKRGSEVLDRPCSNACQVLESRYLRVVQQRVPFSQADEVCRKHGWRLADFSSGMDEQVRYLRDACVDYGTNSRLELGRLWVRSYNGVDGAACISVNPHTSFNLLDSGSGLKVTFGYNPNECDNVYGPLYPLCQLNCDPIHTSLGPITGTLSTFTSLTITTTTIHTAVNTITATVTQWPKHNRRNPDCCCRECMEKRNN